MHRVVRWPGTTDMCTVHSAKPPGSAFSGGEGWPTMSQLFRLYLPSQASRKQVVPTIGMLFSPGSFPCFIFIPLHPLHWSLHTIWWLLIDIQPNDLRNCTHARRCSSHSIPASVLIIPSPHSCSPRSLLLKWLLHDFFTGSSGLYPCKSSLYFSRHPYFEQSLGANLTWHSHRDWGWSRQLGCKPMKQGQRSCYTSASQKYSEDIPRYIFFSENCYFSTKFIWGRRDEIRFNFFFCSRM